jgi:predicted PhzF superfamily epimerase YddE/YHI9
MAHRLHTVDVFTDRALAGNQLAVVLDADKRLGGVSRPTCKQLLYSRHALLAQPRPQEANDRGRPRALAA